MVVERDQKDAELDALMTEALDVEVPADFVAQVRTRLATERTRSSWPVAWTLASATAVAAVVVVWLAYPVDPVMPTDTGSPVAISRAPAADVSPVVAPEPVAPELHAVESQVAATPARRVERAIAAPAPIAAEVIVDGREAIALQRLVSRVREGTFNPPAARAKSAVAENTEILIQPITVAPLAFAADLQLEVAPDRPQDVDHPQGLEELE